MITSGKHEFISRSPEQTVGFGFRIGEALGAGDALVLRGQLGSGKTVITKGLAKGLGVADTRDVRSPTFCLCRVYKGRIPVFHVDAFRMEDPFELYDLDFASEISSGVLIVEWGEKIQSELPEARTVIDLTVIGTEKRRITVATSREEIAGVMGDVPNKA